MDMMFCVWILALTFNSLVFGDNVGEFCNGESFKPQCRDDEVIDVKQAKYGRMRLGRCVEVDLGK